MPPPVRPRGRLKFYESRGLRLHTTYRVSLFRRGVGIAAPLAAVARLCFAEGDARTDAMPRTPRRMMLLAGLLWLAGTGAIWWALPKVAATWPIPSGEHPVGFLGDGRTLVTTKAEIVGH